VGEETFCYAEALEIVGGNAAAAAKSLETGRATMYRKIKEYKLVDHASNNGS